MVSSIYKKKKKCHTETWFSRVFSRVWMKPDRLRPVKFTVLEHQVTRDIFPLVVTDSEGGFDFSFFFFSPEWEDSGCQPRSDRRDGTLRV